MNTAASSATKPKLSTSNNFTLPFWLLNFQELVGALTTSDEHREAETEILGKAVTVAKRRYNDNAVRGALVRKTIESSQMTVETPCLSGCRM